ncbi:MAG: hypothetical protein HY885_06185 [Deltaproteobacteria bacterium]|nr:hypothetical protein [Deltaproteobacteria bacterium]
MGGQGSGRWHRWNSKTTTESQRRLDIRWLKKQGYIRPGISGTLSWTCNGKDSGWISYRIDHDRMVLVYNYRRNGGEWEQVEQTVTITPTPCNYGGERSWFFCPRCWKRVAVLYGAGKYFLCRHCYQLTYESQQEGPAVRILIKSQKIRKRLGGSGATGDLFPAKPKNMHWKTYWRLRNEAEQAENLSWEIAMQRYGVQL